MFTFGSLFAGIGGFDLGFERAGMVCCWQVEIDEYRRKVLAKHWPDVRRYGDVRECGRHNLEAVRLVVGGFPCQPYSVAGKRQGAEDDRNLWPEFLRVVAEIRPAWVVAENVPGIVPLYLDTVLSDLEGEGYSCWPFNIPACAFDAPHIRQRIFILAHCNSRGQQRTGIPVRSGGSLEAALDPGGGCTDVAHAAAKRCNGWSYNERKEQAERNGIAAGGAGVSDAYHAERHQASGPLGRMGWEWRPKDDRTFARDRTSWSVEPDVGRVAHGIPHRVDRLRALGDAVVPQAAEWIGRRIMEVEGL